MPAASPESERMSEEEERDLRRLLDEFQKANREMIDHPDPPRTLWNYDSALRFLQGALVNRAPGLLATLDSTRSALRVAEGERESARRSRESMDCRFAGPLWESSGSHCPFDRPCDRCAHDREMDAAESRSAELSELLKEASAALRRNQIPTVCTCIGVNNPPDYECQRCEIVRVILAIHSALSPAGGGGA